MKNKTQDLKKELQKHQAIVAELEEKILKAEDVKARVINFETACHETGENPKADKYTKGTERGIALEKSITIADALNGDWKADYKNPDQKKYVPYMVADKKGVFRYFTWYCYVGTAGFGSRLALKSPELAEHFGKIAVQYHQIIMS